MKVMQGQVYASNMTPAAAYRVMRIKKELVLLVPYRGDRRRIQYQSLEVLERLFETHYHRKE